MPLVQSRFPRVPYLRFNGEVPEAPFPGGDDCGCRATPAEQAAAILADATARCHCGEYEALCVCEHGPHASPAGSKAHGSKSGVGADVSGANAGSPGAAGVASRSKAGAPKSAAKGKRKSKAKKSKAGA